VLAWLKRPGTLLLLQLGAFWPVWMWYVWRTADGSDEPWGWVALVTALLFVWRNKTDSTMRPRRLLGPSLLLLAYAASYQFLTPLPRAVLAVAALSLTISVLWLQTWLHLGLTGLLLLSLPLVASLQFYLGYPLRAFVAICAAPILRLGGLAVLREGTCLNWSGHLILIDASCSGVRMLWAGLYLTFALACFYGLGTRKTLLAAGLALIAVVVGNLLRAIALFYGEVGIVTLPPWAHTGVGLMAFGLTGALILVGIQRLNAEAWP
jgi:exosortase/archaeosortase family protein